MKFELLTLTGTKFDGEANEVVLNTSVGQIGVLPHHEPLTAIAVAGPVEVKDRSGHNSLFAIFGGVLEVTKDYVRLLADEAEHEDELIESEIQAALEEAEKLKANAKTQHQLIAADRMIDRSNVRLGVAKLKRRHRRNI
jgi:F-type H+-transporting ATPase subunit epsilon